MRINRVLSTLFGLTLPVVAAASSSDLFSAGQESITNDRTVMLFAAVPFTSETVPSKENFVLDPACEIESVSWDVQTSSMVKLHLNAATPLKAGTEYTVSVLKPKMKQKFLARSMKSEHDNILHSALPNGAINIQAGSVPWKKDDYVRISPYFCIMAINGLTRYAQMCDPDFKDLALCDKYITWHISQMASDTGYINDFKGTYSDIKNTNDYDSTDSYGAFLPLAVWRQFALTDDTAKMASRWDAIKRAIAAMISTLDKADGLTIAKPTYPIKYAMDNSEVWEGYFCAAQIARVLGKNAEYAEYMKGAQAMEAAIKKELWSNSKGPWRYVVGKDNGNNLIGDWTDAYYPDGMANDMTLDILHYPGDERMKEGWSATCARYIMNGPLPKKSVELNAVRLAARLGDKPARDRAWASTLKMHDENNYSFMSGLLLDLAWLERDKAMVVPSVASVSTIDWNESARLVFHPVGTRINCFDNTYTEDTSAAAINADTLYVLRAVHSGSDLVLKLTVYDNNVDAASGKEGISQLMIDNKSIGSTTLKSDGAMATVGKASAQRTANGYELFWTVPLGEGKTQMPFNIVCSDVYASGKTENLALSDPKKPARFVIELQK